MRLFGFNPIKEAGGWEVLTSEEEIAEMERQGCDMSSVREKRASKHAPIAAKEQTILPGNRLPEDGIIPFLLETPHQIQITPNTNHPKTQIPVQLSSIPRQVLSGLDIRGIRYPAYSCFSGSPC